MKNFEKFISEHRDGRWIKNYVCASAKACEECPLNKVNCGSDHKVLEWANVEAETKEEKTTDKTNGCYVYFTYHSICSLIAFLNKNHITTESIAYIGETVIGDKKYYEAMIYMEE